MRIEESYNRIYDALRESVLGRSDLAFDLLRLALEYGLEDVEEEVDIEPGPATEPGEPAGLPPQFFVTDWPGTRWLQELRSEISYTGDERDVDEIVRLYTAKFGKVVSWTEESKRLRDPGPFYAIEDREFPVSIRVIRDELRDAGQDEWNTWPRDVAVVRFAAISGKAVAFHHNGW